MKTALYRHYDVNGELLYVGISLDSMRRLAQHSYQADWFREIRHVDIEWHPTRQYAQEAERQAILTEGPVWNVQGNRDRVNSRYGFVVYEDGSGMFDGFYNNYQWAREAADFWDEERPDYSHRVITGDKIPREDIGNEALRLQNLHPARVTA